MRGIPPLSLPLGRSLTLVLLLGGLAAPSALAQRVVMYWTGPDAGTMEIQQNGVGSAYIQIPDDACGFRLSHDPNPFLWNEVWYFADNSALSEYAAINSSESWGPADDIQATGPINGNCQDHSFVFDTPATLGNAGLAAPYGTGAFVAEFYHPDQIEFLDESGAPMDVDIPEPPEVPDPTGPDIDWTIPPSLVNCIQDWENDWHCATDSDSSAVLNVAFAVARYAERAGWAVDASKAVDSGREQSRLAQQAVQILDAIDRLADEFVRLTGNVERETRNLTRRESTHRFVNSVAVGAAVAKLNLAACREQASQKPSFEEMRATSKTSKGPNGCHAASQATLGVLADMLQLQTFEKPSER